MSTLLHNKLVIIVALLVIVQLPALGQSLNNTHSPKDKIQIALLLDVSGSMDKLSLQAKSQFWRISKFLKKGKKKGKKTSFEMAVLTYGGSTGVDFVEILSNFSQDFDSLYQALHEIIIGGGEEYCWGAIQKSLDSLAWSDKKSDLKIILIAGNESFHQGVYHASKILKKTHQKGIILNTIYCKIFASDSLDQEWEDIAKLGQGSYFSISLEEDTLNIMEENFMDKKLIEYNHKLNSTYIPYGHLGKQKLESLIRIDDQYKFSGMAYFRERIAFKAQETFLNPSWDLVDAFQKDSLIIHKKSDLNLPEHLNSLTPSQLRRRIQEKLYKRNLYQEIILLRYEKIIHHLGKFDPKDDLESSIKEILIKEGKKKKFLFK